MATSPIKFYRGKTSFYEGLGEGKANVVFFDTEKHVIYMNEATYGITPEAATALNGSVKSVAVVDGVLTVTPNVGDASTFDLNALIPAVSDSKSGLMTPAHLAEVNKVADKVDKVDGHSLVADSEITKLAGLKSQTDISKEITDAVAAEAALARAAEEKNADDIAALDEFVGELPEGITATTVSGYVAEAVKAEEDRAVAAENGIAARVKTLEDSTAVADAKAEVIGQAGDASTADTIYGAKKYADEKAAAAQSGAETTAQGLVKEVTDDLGSVDSLSTTNKTVVGAINEVLAAVGTGGTAAVVTLEKSADGLTYTLKQGNAEVGIIDIPKDMVVSAGNVVVDPAGQEAGTYIELTLANATNDKLYINVGDLVDIYTAQASAAQVQLAINENEISASIVAGSISATELADNAVITAKIADANVTLAKLSTSVQTSLGKADTAVQSVVEGGSNGTISVDNVEVKVHGLGSAAYTEASAYDASGAAAAVKTEVIGANGDAAEANTIWGAKADATAKANAAQTAAEGHSDANLDTAKTYAEGQASAAETAAKAYADELFVWYEEEEQA